MTTKGTQTHIGGRSGRPSWWVRGWVSVRWLVEGDAKADLDLPAGDADVFDDKAEQALALVKVEAVECLGHALGEAGQALAEPVAFGELDSFGGKTDALAGQQHLRAQQGGTDLVEHERVELIGADVALGAAAVLAASAQGVVVAAVV